MKRILKPYRAFTLKAFTFAFHVIPAIILCLILLTGCHTFKPLPKGVSFAGEVHPTRDIRFLKDVTYLDEQGERRVQQEIFDEVFNLISQAKKFILLDMFLYNDFQGPIPEKTRAVSGELTNLLIEQKRKHPSMQIFLITDPVNTVYGGAPSEQFERLKMADISVTATDLTRLRDSNLYYSPLWRLFFKPFGNYKGGLLPNPFGGDRVSLRSYMTMLNFKANHRKVLIVDHEDTYIGLVSSANPHDGSSAHGNVAVTFTGPAVRDLLATELAVLALSDVPSPNIQIAASEEDSNVTLQVVTEKKIRGAILQSIEQANERDRTDLAMFYLSNRKVVRALKDAHKRGVSLRVLLDPNKDAFGRAKNGIPNRQVARELHKLGIPVRWCDTHGEQCHAKMIHTQYRDTESTLILGSANFTRRNLTDYNLETDVAIRGPSEAEVFQKADRYFDTVWHNNPKQFSVDYTKYQNKSLFKRFLYRFMEATGMCTF